MILLVLSITNSSNTDQIIYVCTYIGVLAIIVLLLLSAYLQEFQLTSSSCSFARVRDGRNFYQVANVFSSL